MFKTSWNQLQNILLKVRKSRALKFSFSEKLKCADVTPVSKKGYPTKARVIVQKVLYQEP